MFHRLVSTASTRPAWVLGTNAPPLDNCIPCDRFVNQQQNIAAIRLALAAFRQLERVGIPAILERVMDRAFKAALPLGTPRRQTVHDAVHKLNVAGLINKNGGRFSLKQL
jgi:hypothetical protein